MKKKLFSIALSIIMCVAYMPMSVFAADADQDAESVSYIYYTSQGNVARRHSDGVCKDYVLVTENTTELQYNKWYVVKGTVDINENLQVNGDANLILTNGSTLNANGTITVTDGNSLSIYAQTDNEDEMGMLHACGDYEHAAIGSGRGTYCGGVFIHGGKILADKAHFAAGIGGGQNGSGGNVVIYNGNITALGICGAGIGGGAGDYDYPGSVVGGSCTIYGGTVFAQGEGGGAGIGGGSAAGSGADVAIYGGNVTAKGSLGVSSGIGAGDRDTETGSKYQGTITLGEDVVFEAGYKEDDIAVTGDSTNATEAFNKSYFHSEYTGKAPVDYDYYVLDGGNPRHREGSCKKYEILTSATTELADGKWYVLNAKVTLDKRISAKGTVNLILCDGAELNAVAGISVNKENTLNIYGQSKGTGVLTATGTDGCAGIGGDSGVDSGLVKIYGGKITATGGSDGAGIGGGRRSNGDTVTVFSGQLKATGGENGAGIGGGLNGGAGGSLGLNDALQVYGGKVIAYGASGASGVGRGKGGNSNGKDITMDAHLEYKAGESESEILVQHEADRAYEGLGWRYFETIAADKPVPYIYYTDESGSTIRHEGCTSDYIIIGPDTVTFENGKWYYLDKDVTINDRIAVKGTANLILGDGATLTAKNGINVAVRNTLNIYAQSEGADKGFLSATPCDYASGIGASGNGTAGDINIHGGRINARGDYGAAGIGAYQWGNGGNVTIYSGEVSATGGSYAPAIGAPELRGTNNGTLTLGDGVVYGAGSAADNITVFGNKRNAEDAFGNKYFVTPYKHDHVYDQEVDEEKYLKSEANCTDAAVYFKSCRCGAASETDTFTSGDAVGHKYGKASYKWAEDKCTAERSCTVCKEGTSGHSQTETVTGTYIKDTDADCTNAEKGHYKAEFENEAFEAQETEKDSATHGDALGHNYPETWEKYDAEQHKHTCTRCGAETEYENHSFNGDTCTACGYVIDCEISLAKSKYTYSGQDNKPEVSVKLDGEVLSADKYEVIYPEKAVNAGKYELKVVMKSSGAVLGTASYEVAKATPNLKVTCASRKCRKSSVRYSAKTAKQLKVTGAKGKLTYKKISGSKKLRVNATTGKITVIKHKCGKRTKSHSIRVKVTCAGTGNYYKASKTIRVTVKMVG